ncbi:Phosphatidylglycerol phosphatidylinositol transfer [Pyrrhoderma noxium]|uniref:Phosphatidylglycerol/phosphatidylinositol transfer protein n=1 Tax=Pyrrhoderma noxium TaxID=2282107 RepID=A0A286UST8_9AGAM|nr:Phosphatidylglycerol phosphatidylinositol transfer [Pyrrhoderma noxium]
MKFLKLLVAALSPVCALSASVLQSNNVELQVEDAPIRTQEGWDWRDCGDTSDPLQIKSIEVFPDPPKPGQDMTVKVKAYAQELIEEGAYADVLVKIGVVKLLEKRFDLCDEAEKAGTEVQCPVEEGEYVVEQTVALPKEIPRAKFIVQVRGYTRDDENLVCTDLSVDFRPKFPHIW